MNREVGIDFEESFAPVARLEAVRIFVAPPQHHIGSLNPDNLEKSTFEEALYGLKQAPRSWLMTIYFLMSKGFTKSTIDPTLFKIKYGEDILLVQIYVDDIIFRDMVSKVQAFELYSFLDVDLAKFALILEKKHFWRDTLRQTSWVICKLCSSNVDEDTSSRLWLQLQQNTLTEYQLADMFTKALPEDRFKYLVRRIGMRCLTPADLEVLTNETA
ncbi:retrovirus-related pol polyprotein from transposon TNT 1-94 [Tanacetum coccineum]